MFDSGPYAIVRYKGLPGGLRLNDILGARSMSRMRPTHGGNNGGTRMCNLGTWSMLTRETGIEYSARNIPCYRGGGELLG